jgi:hypothetical protein
MDSTSLLAQRINIVLVGSAISNAKQKLEGYRGTVLFVSCHLVEKKIAGSLWVPE